jgi:hypothetical protein
MVPALSVLCPRGNDQTRKEPGLRPSLDFVPQGKIRGGHNRGIQNTVRPAMAYYGRIWPHMAINPCAAGTFTIVLRLSLVG